MKKEYSKIVIVYSGFIKYEECYEYNENACFLADSHEIASKFMTECGYEKSDFRIDTIYFQDLIDDYGCSCGEYAMEKIAFENFKRTAEENGVEYKVEEYDLDPTLMVVNVKTMPKEIEDLDY